MSFSRLTDGFQSTGNAHIIGNNYIIKKLAIIQWNYKL